MTKGCPVLPLTRPTPAARALLRDCEWDDAARVLRQRGFSARTIAGTRAVFLRLRRGAGIVYRSRRAQASERALRWRVGERIGLDADFHSYVDEMGGLIFHSTSASGKDFARDPYTPRDYGNGWAADDPLKHLANAQAALIQERLDAEVHAYVSTRKIKRAPNRRRWFATVRARQLDAAGRLCCAACGAWGFGGSAAPWPDIVFVLDHVTALCNNGTDDDPHNLQLLCGVCDKIKTQSDMQRWRTLRSQCSERVAPPYLQ